MARTIQKTGGKVIMKMTFPKRLIRRIEEEAWEVGMSFQQYVRVLLAAHVQLPHAETSRIQNLGEIRLKTKFKDLAVEEEKLSRAMERAAKRVEKLKIEDSKIKQRKKEREPSDEELWKIIEEDEQSG